MQEQLDLVSYFYRRSPIQRLAVSVIMAVLVWMAVRYWWTFQPLILIPLIVGLLLPSMLEIGDLPLVSLITAVIAAVLWPIEGAAAILALIVTTVVMMAVSIGVAALTKNGWRPFLPYIALAIILTGFFAQGVAEQRVVKDNGYSFVDLLNYEPPPKQYAFDGFIYLKTFYLMKQGSGYYDSLKGALLGDQRSSALPASVMGWREPTVFYIWNILFSTGEQVGIGFLLLTSIVAILVFLVAKELSNANLAVLPAALVCGYYMYGVASMWIVFVEYWALPVSLAATLFFLRGKNSIAAAFAAAVPLFRELYIFTLMAGFFGTLVDKNLKKILVWVAAGFAFLGIYFLHYLKVKTMVPGPTPGWGGVQGGGLQFILDSISFSTDNLVTMPNVPVAFYIFGLIGLLSVPSLRNKVFFAALVVLPLIVFYKFLGYQWSYYWGVCYMPFALLGFAPALVVVERLLVLMLERLGIQASVEVATR